MFDRPRQWRGGPPPRRTNSPDRWQHDKFVGTDAPLRKPTPEPTDGANPKESENEGVNSKILSSPSAKQKDTPPPDEPAPPSPRKEKASASVTEGKGPKVENGAAAGTENEEELEY
ncbi:hypothetical protein HK104_010064 [Borealophlyctis nickersoniae]|nr:hypothetical protein HK104_010064 [Borealophlyctis nickersoniae]